MSLIWRAEDVWCAALLPLNGSSIAALSAASATRAPSFRAWPRVSASAASADARRASETPAALAASIAGLSFVAEFACWTGSSIAALSLASAVLCLRRSVFAFAAAPASSASPCRAASAASAAVTITGFTPAAFAASMASERF